MKASTFLKTAVALVLLFPALARAAILSAPLITPGGDSYFDAADVSIFSGNVGATIYYTTDGTDPTTSSTPFTFPFTLTASTTVKAFAYRAGDTSSPIVTEVYDISPTPEDVIPTVTISGKRSLKTTKAKIKIKGTATDATEVDYQVGIDGDYKTAAGTSSWSFVARLKPGKNVIYVYAIGETEDSDPAKITITLVKK